jgi:hypothetical protein
LLDSSCWHKLCNEPASPQVKVTDVSAVVFFFWLLCRALEAVLTELARVRLHGFSEREFNNAVKSMQVSLLLVSVQTIQQQLPL